LAGSADGKRQIHDRQHRGSDLRAGGNLLIDAKQNIFITAGALSSGDELMLMAGGELNLLAAYDRDYHYRRTKDMAVIIAMAANAAAGQIIGAIAGSGSAAAPVVGSTAGSVGAGGAGGVVVNSSAGAAVGTTSTWAASTTLTAPATVGSTTWATGTVFGAGLGNVAVSAGIGGLTSSAAMQAIANDGDVDWALAFKSGLAAALSAGVGRYFGDGYSISRVIAETAAGCASGELTGGNCGDNARLSFGIALLSWAGDAMRDMMVEQSKAFGGICAGAGCSQKTDVCTNENNCHSNFSANKTGGVRLNIQEICKQATSCTEVLKEDGKYWVEFVVAGTQDVEKMADILQAAVDTTSYSDLFGGAQGGPGVMFWLGYDPDSLPHKLVEAYGGPHDWFNGVLWGGYETVNDPANLRFVGNAAVLSPAHSAFLKVMNVVDVILSTPFAAGVGILDGNMQWLLNLDTNPEKKD
jgi:hypothetical protein